MDFSEALQLFYIHEILLITWKMPIFWRSIMLSDIWFMVNSYQYIHSLLNHAFTFLTDYHTFPPLSFLLPPRYQRESEQIWGRIQNLRMEQPTLCVTLQWRSSSSSAFNQLHHHLFLGSLSPLGTRRARKLVK